MFHLLYKQSERADKMERNIQEDPLLHINRIWGPKVQAKALYEMVHNGLSSRDLAERNPHFASERTYRRLYRHFQLYGEIPHQTAMRKKRNRLKVHRRQMPNVPLFFPPTLPLTANTNQEYKGAVWTQSCASLQHVATKVRAK